MKVLHEQVCPAKFFKTLEVGDKFHCSEKCVAVYIAALDYGVLLTMGFTLNKVRYFEVIGRLPSPFKLIKT